MTIRIFLASLLLAGTWVTASSAQAAIKHTIDIPAQGLGPALAELARQTGIQLVYSAHLVEGVNAAPLSGSMTPPEALRRLLAHTKLHFEFLDPRTVTLSSPVTEEPRSQATGEGSGRASVIESASQAILLAQAETASSDSAARDQGRDSAPSRELPRPEESGKAIPEMLVKGKRTLNMDIRRTENDVQPYVVFEAEDIKRSMAVDLSDFFKTRLPMNATALTNDQNPGVTNGNQSTIDLRGLGINQTLILVNGRQVPRANNLGAFSQADINGIPLAAIERIEVLPSTASGIYGGGATGGVINVITKQDYAGLDVNLTYGNTFDTDSSTRRADVGAGFSLEGGRTQMFLSASHSESNPLLVGDRDFARRGRQLLLENNPAALIGGINPPLGHTTNIRNDSPNQNANLVLDAAYGGATLGAPFTHVPVGYQGPSSDGGAALIANAGQYNLELPADIAGAGRSLVTQPTVQSAMLNLRRQFTSNIEFFLDTNWRKNVSSSTMGFLPGAFRLPANSPGNPFTTNVNVTYPGVGLENTIRSENEQLRAAGGLIVRLPGDWAAAVDYGWNRSRLEFSTAFPIVDDPDGPGPGLSLTAALQTGTVDVMRDLNQFPLDYSPYLMPSPNQVLEPAETVLTDISMRVSGPVFELPGGEAAVTALAQSREEETKDAYQHTLSGVTWFPRRAQNVDSYYLETRVPVFSESNALSLARLLEVQASVRHDAYETRTVSPSTLNGPSKEGPFPAFAPRENDVSATKYTFGVRFSPFSSLMLRASIGTGFLAPQVNNIVSGEPLQTFLFITDPKRGNTSAAIPVTFVGGGNPDLEPEDSESWSAGMIFTPAFLESFRFAVDYTNIEKTNEIGQLLVQTVVDLEDLLPGRVTRAPLTPADIDAGYTGGVITALDGRAVNMAQTRLETYDFKLDYTFQTEVAGDFRVFAAATYMPNFERRAVLGTPLVNQVGSSGNLLEWRGNAGLSWERGPWMVSWTARYYHEGLSYSVTSSALTQERAILDQGSETIRSQMYHDVYGGYRIGEGTGWLSGLLADTEIYGGIRNVFDDSPPIRATSAPTGGYSFYGDPRLRSYTISLRKRF